MMYATGHPDPVSQSEFYDSVATKRLFAWIIDVCVTLVLAAPLMVPVLLISALLVFPILLIPTILAVTGFVYRWATISGRSATWGMRLMAIELRGKDGHHLDGTLAFFHTLGTTLSFAAPPVQLISALFMAVSDRGQGITDMVLGTTMVNRSA